MIPIIAFAGRAGSGKSTAQQIAVRMYGGYPYCFADPIRRMMKAGLGIVMEDPYWQDRKEQPIPWLDGVTPRRLMQTLGTEWGRSISPQLWVRLAQGEYSLHGPGMVIGDARFDNEAEWVRNAGGVVIQITRGPAPVVEAHVSENGISEHLLDGTVTNDGSIDELTAALLRMLRNGHH